MSLYLELHSLSSIYRFRIYPLGTDFSRIGGLYSFLIIPHEEILMEQVSEGNETSMGLFYSLLYVGITNNFDSRLKKHHKLVEARELGMSHIGVLKVRSGRRRKVIEKDLLRSLNPPLNDTYKKG